MIPPNQSISPYTILSFCFFILCPLFTIGHSMRIPIPITLLIFLFTPKVMLKILSKYLPDGIAPYDPNNPKSRTMTMSVIFQSIILGLAWCFGYQIILSGQQHMLMLGAYIILLSTFHYGEFFVLSLTSPKTLDTNSFLLNNSLAYTVAITCSFLEYMMGVYFYPNLKDPRFISLIGLVLCVFGDVIRKLAMFTAGESFSHSITSVKRPEHRLITHGLYGVFRHPAYAGWFYWALGSQILLHNPACFVLFALVSNQFFRDRILYEEETLIQFFGSQYKDYQTKVKLWMPIW